MHLQPLTLGARPHDKHLCNLSRPSNWNWLELHAAFMPQLGQEKQAISGQAVDSRTFLWYSLELFVMAINALFYLASHATLPFLALGRAHFAEFVTEVMRQTLGVVFTDLDLKGDGWMFS